MKPSGQNLFRIVAIAGCLCGPLRAQEAVPSTLASVPLKKSPVALFRDLLAMSPADRDRALASRPPAVRQRIVEKLQEYQILPDNVREWRLRETELRYFLLPLMSIARTNRAPRLALIPEETRKLVEERLQTWDVLPPDLQQEFLNSETVRNFIARYDSPSAQREFERMLPPGRRAELEAGVAHWQALSEEQRRKISQGFNRIFELTIEEREKVLNQISDEERQQMEATLAGYSRLRPDQRVRCIRSFEKFASMSLADRQQFLKNAERWSEMSPAERQVWRDLVATAPIMPHDPWSGPLPSSARPVVMTN